MNRPARRTYTNLIIIGTLAAVALTGCHAPSPAAGPTPTPAPTATAASPLAPAFQAVLDQAEHDGAVVTTATALRAFAVAFGPLPGVTTPAGTGGTIPDGTLAVQWLVGHWADISPAQRAAAVGLLPVLAGLGTAPSTTVTTGTAYHRLARPNTFYTQLAQQQANILAAKVGKSMTLKIVAQVGVPVTASSDAETNILNSTGGFTGTAAQCLIVVSANGDKLTGDDLMNMMTHEAWHCFEGQYGGITKFWSLARPDWIYEGEATFVGDAYYPDSGHFRGLWADYLTRPWLPLYSQRYAAVGFFAQLQDAGFDVWSHLIAMVQTTDNVSAFTTAGADNDKFLNVWASGLGRDASRGLPWDITGYGVPATPGLRTPIAVGDGGSVGLQAPPWTNQLYALADSSSEVLVVTMSGHARLSDAGEDYLVQAGDTFCHRSAGCECPTQATDTPPILALPGPGILLALTGGLTGSTGAVTGMSLMDFCNRLSGTWTGTWQDQTPDSVNGTFTLTWTQKGNALNGTITVTGTPCVTVGTVTGTLAGNTITFGAVQGQRAVQYSGTIAKNTMSGTYTAPKCGEAQGVWTASRKK